MNFIRIIGNLSNNNNAKRTVSIIASDPQAKTWQCKIQNGIFKAFI